MTVEELIVSNKPLIVHISKDVGAVPLTREEARELFAVLRDMFTCSACRQPLGENTECPNGCVEDWNEE